jgi:hypothetical protein
MPEYPVLKYPLIVFQADKGHSEIIGIMKTVINPVAEWKNNYKNI